MPKFLKADIKQATAFLDRQLKKIEQCLNALIDQDDEWRENCRIRGGRSSILTVLWMAALSTVQHNPVIRDFYQSLVARGKHKKIALIACTHKMITILNTMIRDGVCWKNLQKIPL